MGFQLYIISPEKAKHSTKVSEFLHFDVDTTITAGSGGRGELPGQPGRGAAERGLQEPRQLPRHQDRLRHAAQQQQTQVLRTDK